VEVSRYSVTFAINNVARLMALAEVYTLLSVTVVFIFTCTGGNSNKILNQRAHVIN